MSSGHLALRQTPTPLLTAVPVRSEAWAAEVEAVEARRAAAKGGAHATSMTYVCITAGATPQGTGGCG